MKLILDACIAVAAMLEEEHTPAARALLEEFRKQIHELLAPDLLPAEMGHALMRAERKGIIDPGEGKVLFDYFINSCPQLFPYGDLFDRAMEIESNFRTGFYDSCYVALAEQEGCSLVTTDEKLINSLPGFPIVHLTDL